MLFYSFFIKSHHGLKDNPKKLLGFSMNFYEVPRNFSFLQTSKNVLVQDVIMRRKNRVYLFDRRRQI